MKFHEVFKDRNLNIRMNSVGYVVLNDFLSMAEVQRLRDIYFTTGDASCREAFTTFAAPDDDYRRKIDAATKVVFSPLFEKYFSSYLPYWGNYFCKKPGDPQMPLHADWQYVDEPHFISINIWCPLTDADSASGAFGVVPCSHRAVNQCRGMNLYQFYLKHGETIKNKFGLTLQLKPGTAVIYDHRLLHYSLPNVSTRERLAVTMIGVPAAATVVHYAAEYEGGSVLKYVLRTPDDLLHLRFKKLPENLIPVASPGKIDFSELTPLAVEEAIHAASGAPQQVADTQPE